MFKKLLMKDKKKAIRIALLAILLTAAVIMICVYAGYVYYYSHHFFKGTVINQIDCSGLTVEETENLLAARVEEYSLELVFRGDSREVISGSEIGYQYVSDGSVQAVKDEQTGWKWIQGYFVNSNKKIEVQTSYDSQKLRQQLFKLPELQEENMTAPKDASVEYQDGEFRVAAEIEGTTLDRELVLQAVEQAVEQGQTILQLEQVENAYSSPSLTQEDTMLQHQATQLNNWASASITYQLPTGQKVLDGNVLREWLTLDEAGNYVKDEEIWKQHIAEFVEELAEQVDTAGKDRQFEATGLGVITIKSGDYGWKINQLGEIGKLTRELEDGTVTTREPFYLRREPTTENYGLGNSYVEIDLSRQHLWLYQDGKLTVETDIVSGKMTEKRYTPEGIFKMYYKQKNKTLRGEKKPDGTYEYEVTVNYWMPFNGGIGMHDADWNPSFGGTRYVNNGSHGCINLPLDAARKIYGIMTTDMPIICYYSQPYQLKAG